MKLQTHGPAVVIQRTFIIDEMRFADPRMLAERRLGPSTMQMGEYSRTMLARNSRAVWLRKSRVGFNWITWLAPAARNQSDRCCQVLNRAGTDCGRRTADGCGSNAKATTRPSGPAACFAAWISCTWPKWTPSKLPIVMAVGWGMGIHHILCVAAGQVADSPSCTRKLSWI